MQAFICLALPWTHRARTALLSVLIHLAVALPALADGKVFTLVAAPPATMPDQQALIVHRDGVETLAIETRVDAPQGDLAWVVPLPEAPQILPASRGLFPTLRAMCAPRIRPFYSVLPLLILVVIALAIGTFLPRWTLARFTAYAALALACVACLVPALGKSRALGGQEAQVEVLDRRIVGSFDTEVIRSADPQALRRWLKENGFGVPPESESAIDEYVAKGWVFAAMKLRQDDSKMGLMTPHPLVFRFKTPTPVYPMRLTMPQDRPFALDLYVFGEHQASVPGMTVQTAGRVYYDPAVPSFGAERLQHVRPAADLVVAHDAIDVLARPATYLTKLSASWPLKTDVQDLAISWDRSAGEVHPRRWDSSDALAMASQYGISVLIAGLLVAIVCRAFKVSTRTVASIPIVAGCIGLCTATVIYWSTPRIETVSSRETRDVLSDLAYRVSDASEQARARGERYEFERLRREFTRVSRALAKERGLPREEAAIEEDSPGNYSFAVDPQDPSTVWVFAVTSFGYQYPLNYPFTIDPPRTSPLPERPMTPD